MRTRYFLHPESIRRLFDSVAPTYDLLNHLLSLRRDVSWRRRAVRELEDSQGWILDIATGTGDVAIEIACRNGTGRRVFGVDFSRAMIERAHGKLQKKGLFERVSLGFGDALALPFREETFSASIIAFGLRNIVDKEQALLEMIRVIQRGGRVIVLEFTLPRPWVVRKLYSFYFQRLLPRAGGLLSGDRGAYAYLPQSVFEFPDAETYAVLMRRVGLEGIRSKTLTCGIASIITGVKRPS